MDDLATPSAELIETVEETAAEVVEAVEELVALPELAEQVQANADYINYLWIAFGILAVVVLVLIYKTFKK